MKLEEIYFVDRENVESYLLSGVKIYTEENYYQSTKNGIGLYDLSNKLIKHIDIDESIKDILNSECKVDLD
jgi:hypothetical protein